MENKTMCLIFVHQRHVPNRAVDTSSAVVYIALSRHCLLQFSCCTGTRCQTVIQLAAVQSAMQQARHRHLR